jgi:ubiquinone biosynthesis protein UbiJ
MGRNPSESISLEWIGQTLRAIQAEQRVLHTENRLIRDELAQKLTREEAERMVRAFLSHVSAFEARTDTRFDRLEARLEQLAADVAALRSRE